MRFSYLIRLGTIVLSLLIYGLVWNLYSLYKPVGVPPYWESQFFIILLISACVAIITHLLTIDWIRVAGFTLRSFLALIVINSMPEQMPIYAPLIAIILFEIFLVAPTEIGVCSSLFLIILMTWERHLTNQTWGYSHLSPGLVDFVLPWGECIIAIICGILIRGLLNWVTQLSIQAEQLQKSNIRLVEANLGLQDYTIRQQRESIMNERNRISREIHDSVGYILTNLIAVLDYTRELIIAGKEEALEKLDNGREQAREALVEVRRAVRALRPPIEVSQLKAISSLISAFSEVTGIEVSTRMVDLPDSLSEEMDWLIYRVIQEALTNTFRHGHANHVFINVYLKNKLISITIWDNGLGTTNIKLGCGLTGIQERVKDLGGRFEVESGPNQGFTIKILIPWTSGKLGIN